MIILNLYAMYDKRSKTLGQPFIAANDEVAREKQKNTIKIMREQKEEAFEEEHLTVLNLGYWRATIIENKDNQNITRSYEPCILENDKIYDINNMFEEIKPRNEIVLDITSLKYKE